MESVIEALYFVQGRLSIHERMAKMMRRGGRQGMLIREMGRLSYGLNPYVQATQVRDLEVICEKDGAHLIRWSESSFEPDEQGSLKLKRLVPREERIAAGAELRV